TVTCRRSSAGTSTRRGGAPAGAGADSSSGPQDGQKRASGGTVAPHEGQRRSSAVPHAMQKRAPSGLVVEQDAQTRPAISGEVSEAPTPDPPDFVRWGNSVSV